LCNIATPTEVSRLDDLHQYVTGFLRFDAEGELFVSPRQVS